MPMIYSFSLPNDHPMIPVLNKMKNRSTYLRNAISNDARWRQQYQTSLRIYSWLKKVAEKYDGDYVIPPFDWFVVELDELAYQTEDVASE